MTESRYQLVLLPRGLVITPFPVSPTQKHTHPASLSRGLTWSIRLWEGQCGSLSSQAISQRPEWVENVLLAFSFKTWNTFFNGKKYYAETFCFLNVCKSTLQTIKKYVICLQGITTLQSISTIIPTLCGLNSLL